MSFFSNLLSGLMGGPAEPLPTDAVLIDVRSATEFSGGHISGALNLPLDTLGQQIQCVVPDQNAAILVYCRSGMRSGQALALLRNMGYQKVINGGSVGSLALRMQRQIQTR
jgi:phage shock protein E